MADPDTTPQTAPVNTVDPIVGRTDRQGFVNAVGDMMNELIDQLVTQHNSDDPLTPLTRERDVCGVHVTVSMN